MPPAVGLLGAAAYGRRTGMLAVMFASLYFPFIEYGALFLSEIHFILWLTLSFAALFAAHHAAAGARRLALAAAGGVALSIAAAFKSVALPAAFLLGRRRGVALLVARRRPPTRRRALAQRLRPWLLRWAVVAVAAAPLLGVLARACTRANAGPLLRHGQQGRRPTCCSATTGASGRSSGRPAGRRHDSGSAAPARTCAATRRPRTCRSR